MNDNMNLELKRETIFQDAVLSQAEARGMEIIAEAGQNRAKELQEAYQSCVEADYDLVKARMKQKNQHSVAAYTQKARRQLLQMRAEKVDEMFALVQKRLEEFAQSGEYPAYLRGLLEKHAGLPGGGKQPTVYLRAEDEAHKTALARVWPSARFEVSPRVVLGGLAVEKGNVLYDETLDEKLEEQRRLFCASGRLSI